MCYSPVPSTQVPTSVYTLQSNHFKMPFRDKMKRAFGRPSNDDSDLAQVSSTASRKERKQKREYPDNVYKPGEVMPRPKYRAVYNKEHQDKLSAFSFGDAWKRRKSDQSQYSPRGSRLPSVVGSLRRMSLAAGPRSRKQSIAADRVDENIDRDDDVSNGESAGHGKVHLLPFFWRRRLT